MPLEPYDEWSRKHYDTYYDEKHGEERVVIDSQLYRVVHTKVGAPESNRFTGSGSEITSWTSIDEAGNPVSAKNWHDPGWWIEGEVRALHDNFVWGVGRLRRRGRRAYPGAELDRFRERLTDLNEDLETLEALRRAGISKGSTERWWIDWLIWRSRTGSRRETFASIAFLLRSVTRILRGGLRGCHW